MHYVLIGKVPHKVDCLISWSMWHSEQMKHGGLHVKRTTKDKQKPLRKGGKMLAKINRKRAQSWSISTVFLGIDHNHVGWHGAAPILFETMVFGGDYDGYQERYFTFDDALEGHNLALKKLH